VTHVPDRRSSTDIEAEHSTGSRGAYDPFTPIVHEMLATRSIPLGRYRDCDLRLDPALLLALGYLGWSLGDRYQHMNEMAELGGVQLLAPPAVWAMLVVAGAIAGLVLHEAAHALAAWLAGMRTRRIVISVLSARGEMVGPAGGEVVSALAGPFVSLVLGAGLLALAGGVGDHGDARLALGDLARVHLVLGIANLMPVFPLDGGRAFRAMAGRHVGVRLATLLIARIGKIAAVACVVLAIVSGTIPLLFIAVFLWAGASSELARS
jgi:Zn-dependent protease